MIPELKEMTYEKRLAQLGLWTLEERRNRADLLEVFKMHRGLTKIPFERFFELDGGRRTRDHPLVEVASMQYRLETALLF